MAIEPARATGAYSELAGLARETLEGLAEPEPEQAPGPILELVGAYAHELPLIDDIAPSADPDLCLAAEALGPRAEGMQGWEIALCARP
ncbi:MAG: hypothetical protein N2378_05280 [Chloroflexaceae bacterium]|nr:hypothetical protein [Chloroflexaceae bacterium]